jgi:hypothetical protein
MTNCIRMFPQSGSAIAFCLTINSPDKFGNSHFSFCRGFLQSRGRNGLGAIFHLR